MLLGFAEFAVGGVVIFAAYLAGDKDSNVVLSHKVFIYFALVECAGGVGPHKACAVHVSVLDGVLVCSLFNGVHTTCRIWSILLLINSIMR